MADFSGLGDKAKDFANSDKGEEMSDAGLDKASDAADSATGGKFTDKIEAGEKTADGKIGGE